MSAGSDDRIEKVTTPDLTEVVKEINQARSDCDAFWQESQFGHAEFHCLWKTEGETRTYADGEEETLPWEGASDSRYRIVQPLIREHVSFAIFTFLRSKVQARAIRPLIEGRDSNVAEKLLKWRIFTHMRNELLRELSLAWTWMFTRGLVVMGVEWEQQRTIEEVPVNAQEASQLLQSLGQDDTALELFSDAEPSPTLLDIIQMFSPVISRDQARKIVKELRTDLQTTVPIVFLVQNKPKWTALRMVHDILMPSSASDIQSERWIARRELVTETELTDRIKTEGYDPDFVEEAIKQKGKFAAWHVQDRYSATAIGGERDLIELLHFYSKRLVDGTPCVYRTVFSEPVVGVNSDLCAVHQVHPYKHKQYPFVLWRWQAEHRMLLHERGIAHETWSDQRDVKRNWDGMTDRADLQNRPPAFVNALRYEALKGRMRPGHYVGINRPNDLAWAPIPPSDGTPLKMMELKRAELRERYALFGAGVVDPALLQIRREHLSGHVLSQLEEVLTQTWQLQQQYETQQDVERVAGKSGMQFPATTKEIQGRYEITATIDTRMLNEDYAEDKLNFLTKLLPFKQEGGLVFKYGAELLDPDLADALTEDQASPTAMQKEKDDEYSALSQILSGIEPQKNLMANHRFRLQTIQEILSDPGTQQAFMQNQVAQKRLKNRMEFYQNQIVQHTQNPQIGRALSTTTFDSKQAPALQMSTNGTGE